MTEPTYRAFYPGADATLVMGADTKRFPARDNAHQAAADARLHWHKEGEHIVVYRMDVDGSITQLTARVYRVVELV